MDVQILIFGAGKSTTCLIDYLIKEAASNNWRLTIADSNLALAQAKAGNSPHASAVALSVEDASARATLIETASIVISMLPPALHFLVAKDCVAFGKNLLTASYLDADMRSLEAAIQEKQLLFICEMGLDPGIDHMSAMQLIHGIEKKGGSITSFVSHCGGLVAPESDDNPWHYKITWNPRNVVMAGKAGAVFRQHHQTKKLLYTELFNEQRPVSIPELPAFCWYPNRDSLPYIATYGLTTTATFIRTTLRHPEFIQGWHHLIALQLTREDLHYQSNGLSLANFYQRHFKEQGLQGRLDELMEATPLFRHQLEWLGMNDHATIINRGTCSAMDILQFALENKLALKEGDLDMVVMLHEFQYLQGTALHEIRSHLVVKGEDSLRTAMAKTVGLPLAIAAKLVLQGIIKETGLHIPVSPGIYEAVLPELAAHGIRFSEEERLLNASATARDATL